MPNNQEAVDYSPPIFKQIRIENTNLCAYKCIMCPREKLTRASGIMPLEDLAQVLDRIGPGALEIHCMVTENRLLTNHCWTRPVW